MTAERCWRCAGMRSGNPILRRSNRSRRSTCPVRRCALSRDGRFCVAPAQDGPFRPGSDPCAVWELASGTVFCPLKNDVSGGQLTFHRNGRWLLAGGGNGNSPNVDLWTGTKLQRSDGASLSGWAYSRTGDSAWASTGGDRKRQFATTCRRPSGFGTGRHAISRLLLRFGSTGGDWWPSPTNRVAKSSTDGPASSSMPSMRNLTRRDFRRRSRRQQFCLRPRRPGADF